MPTPSPTSSSTARRRRSSPTARSPPSVGPALKQSSASSSSSTTTIRSTPGPASGSGRSSTRRSCSRATRRSRGRRPADESAPIALNYTSGTTGRPKGVVYHHRGTFLETVGNIMAWPLPPQPVYLWTLPLFHCNGWCFGWSVVAMGGTHVCLRAVDPALVFPMIVEHGVTHMCGAPTVLSMLINAPADQQRRFAQVVDIQTGGSPPPAKVIKEHGGARLPRHAHLRHDRAAGALDAVRTAEARGQRMPIEERAVRDGAAGRPLPGRRRPHRRRSENLPAGAAGRHRPSARSSSRATP